MNRTYSILSLLFVFLLSNSFRQGSTYPWKATQLLAPADLAETLKGPKNLFPAIFNIGTAANIKSAIYIGAAEEKVNQEKLKKALLKVPRKKAVVIYCGCCTLEHCPNIRPAFNILHSLGYTNFKVLNLATDLDMDWINKGYPM